MAFERPKLLVDREFARLLAHLLSQVPQSVEWATAQADLRVYIQQMGMQAEPRRKDGRTT